MIFCFELDCQFGFISLENDMEFFSMLVILQVGVFAIILDEMVIQRNFWDSPISYWERESPHYMRFISTTNFLV